MKNVDLKSQGGTSNLPPNAMSAGYSQIDDEAMRGSKLTTKEDSLILYESKHSGPDNQSLEGSLDNTVLSDKGQVAIHYDEMPA